MTYISRFNNDKDNGDAGFPNISLIENNPHLFERITEHEPQIKTLSQTETHKQTKTEGKIMAKIDITPHLPEFEKAVHELVEPPFRIWEPFTLLSVCGDILHDAEPAGTKDEYQEALLSVWDYLEDKYKLIEKLDDAIKLGALLEPFDAWLFKKAIVDIGIPQLAQVLADKVH